MAEFDKNIRGGNKTIKKAERNLASQAETLQLL